MPRLAMTAGRARVLLLAIDYPPVSGGISRLLGHLVECSADRVEWRVVTTSRGPVEPGVQRVPGWGRSSMELGRAARWLRASPDRLVVTGHPFLAPVGVGLGAAVRARTGALAYGRELVPRRAAHHTALAGLRAHDRVVAISGHTAMMVERLGVAPGRVRVVLPAFGSSWLRSSAPARRTGEGVRLVVVARLAEGYKNIELPLRIASVLGPVGAIEELVVVGDGPRRGALEERARRWGAAPFVRFTGWLRDDEVRVLLGSCHIGLFPSRWSRAEEGFEGFGLVIHEFAAAGLPVLVGDEAGARDAAVAPWAMLIDPDDLGAWVESVDRLANDEDHRVELARAAWEWAAAVDSALTAHEYVEALRG
ncbi:MAG: glycosyltransferase [Acidimicrobiales bacterium]|nr:glycosyltransferase [Acidimicrobiales bacterium]